VSTPPSERSLVLVKPDAVRRGLVGEIIGRFERKGLVIEAMELRAMDAELADQHYADHVEKAFYPPLKEFMTGGPLVALVLSGDQVIEVVRAMIGASCTPPTRRRARSVSSPSGSPISRPAGPSGC
jgi:nucleoside-diphosphate kinase